MQDEETYESANIGRVSADAPHLNLIVLTFSLPFSPLNILLCQLLDDGIRRQPADDGRAAKTVETGPHRSAVNDIETRVPTLGQHPQPLKDGGTALQTNGGQRRPHQVLKKFRRVGGSRLFTPPRGMAVFP